MPRRITTIAELELLQESEAEAVSGWIAVPQSAIDAFANLTGDAQWIHVDTERAATEGDWGGTIAHGFFTLSLLSRMAADAFHLELGQSATVNYGLNRVRFPAPVRAGDRVRGRFHLLGCGARPKGIEVVWQVTVDVEGGTRPVCTAEWVLLLAGSPAGT